MAAALNGHAAPTLGGTDAQNSPIHQMQKYFGPLRNSDVETWAADQFAHETHNLPKAYEGRNKFLMATIDFLITKDDDWYTSAVLPWEYTEELHVAWNVWRFNKTMMDYEPHQGVPRYVTQESESHQDSLSRRGLAFIIEHGFWKTELGRSHYLMNLRQIVEAVHETTFFGVMMALLGADNHYEQWNRKHGTVHRTALQRTLEDEKFLWAVVQKNIKGLFVMDAELKDRMRRQGIEPTAWIFPPKMSIYASMIPEYFNEFQRRGETAKNALETGARMFDSFRGLPVYETRTFDVDFQGDGIEPLTSVRACGEHYVMEPEDFTHGIRIFNMDSDRFELVKYPTARANLVNRVPRIDTQADFLLKWPVNMEHRSDLLARMLTGLGEGRLRQIATSGQWYADTGAPMAAGAAGFSNLAKTPIIGILNAQYQTQNDQLFTAAKVLAARVLEYVDAGVAIPGTDDSLIHALQADGESYIYPHRIVLLRPWQTYRMSDAILGRVGSELGHTFHGHHDFQLTDDVIHKVHIGHYTFYSKSIIRQPKNMYIARSVFCQGYEYGENITFVSRNQNNNGLDGLPQGNHRSTVNSLLAVAIPLTGAVPNPLCANGHGFHDTLPQVDVLNHERGMLPRFDPQVSPYENLQPNGVAGANFRVAPGGPIPPNTAQPPRQNDALNNYFDTSTPPMGLSHTDVRTANVVCWRGASQHYHVVSGSYSIHKTSTGHWGQHVYDGCGDVRKGLYANLDPNKHVQ